MSRSQAVRVKYDDVVLVCRECHGDAKRIAKELKRALHDQSPRPRVVRSSCLDVCPKRDVCVAYAGRTGLVARVIDAEAAPGFAAEIARVRAG